MDSIDAESGSVRRARQLLSEQFIHQPGVGLIGIGYDPQIRAVLPGWCCESL